MVTLVRNDLEFILRQIQIAEANAAGTPLLDLVGSVMLPYGLRTTSGIDNNLLPGRSAAGAADNVMPRLLTPDFNTAQTRPANLFYPGQRAGTTTTSYASTSGAVYDSQPRTISNLIADQSAGNVSAVTAALNAARDAQFRADAPRVVSAYELVQSTAAAAAQALALLAQRDQLALAAGDAAVAADAAAAQAAADAAAVVDAQAAANAANAALAAAQTFLATLQAGFDPNAVHVTPAGLADAQAAYDAAVIAAADANAGAGDPMRAHPQNRLTVEPDLPLARFNDPGNGLHRGAFTGTVSAK